jgi:hypothetical protein
MIFGYVLLAVAVTISLVAAYYSIAGLTAIFAAAVVPIIIMGAALELGKVVSTVWLHNNWRRVPFLFKAYLVPAVAFLMFLTSMGIFGFLSKAHTDQALVSGDVGAKIAIYDEKIKLSRDNIDANRRALTQLDAAVDQTMARSNDERGAERAVQIRRSQQTERTRLLREIDAEQRKIAALNEEAAPIRAEVRKVEAEVGPIKYIAAMVYGDNPDANLLESAVRWVIILIVIVFDPLALCLILAANKQFEWAIRGEGGWIHRDDSKDFEVKNFFERARFWAKKADQDATVVEPAPAKPAELKSSEPEVDIEHVNRLAAEAAEDARADSSEGSLIVEIVEDEEHKPYKGRGSLPAMPVTAPYYQSPKKKRTVSKKKKPVADTPAESTDKIIKQLSQDIAEVTLDPTEPAERPGDYLPIVEQKVREAAPGRNRGVMYSQPVQADNTPELGKASRSSFGNEFPNTPEKGDVYLRTDYLPNRLFKFNGRKWIEVDKAQTDVYAYDELYIKHLVDEIAAGRYDPESLTDAEREQIQTYLTKNA